MTFLSITDQLQSISDQELSALYEAFINDGVLFDVFASKFNTDNQISAAATALEKEIIRRWLGQGHILIENKVSI